MNLAHNLAHFLVPRHTNNHKAKALGPTFLTFLALSLLTLQLGIHFMARNNVGPVGQVLGYASNISVSEVIALTNQKRAEAGVPALRENPNLDQGASSKGAHMLANNYWAHVAPDGTQPWKFFGDVGYKYKYAGENLARDFSTAAAAVDAWMASPTHKENMLSAKYQEIGIGVVEGDLSGVDTTIIVQFFGTTLADSLAPVPVAAADQTTAPAATPRSSAVAAATTPVPSQRPVVTSTPQAAPVGGDLSIASGTSDQVLVSPFVTTQGLSTIIIISLLVVLVVDIVVVSRRRITRVSSRSFAHVAFLGIILLIVLIVQAGRIL